MCRKVIQTLAPVAPMPLAITAVKHPPPPPPPPQRHTEQAKQIRTKHYEARSISYKSLQTSFGLLAQQTFLFIYLAAVAAATTRALGHLTGWRWSFCHLHNVMTGHLHTYTEHILLILRSCFLKHIKMWSCLVGSLPSSVAESAGHLYKIIQMPLNVLLLLHFVLPHEARLGCCCNSSHNYRCSTSGHCNSPPLVIPPESILIPALKALHLTK